MRTANVRTFAALAAFLIASRLFAQNAEQPAYLNASLPAEQRAADLVHRMTMEEKVTQLVNQSRAVPRLNVPAYDWWSEALHGVASSGTTEFPEPVGLAVTFDTDAIHHMAVAIGIEGRIKHKTRRVAEGALRTEGSRSEYGYRSGRTDHRRR